MRDTAAHRFLAGNRLSLLNSGSEYFPALIAAIDAAVHEVHLETYIFADDATGRRVAAALARAAQRGVAVRVLVDGFGAREFAAGLGASLTTDRAEVMTYRPEIGQFRFRRHRLRRLHRKLVVVDGRLAFVGGINVLDDFDDGKAQSPRFDYAVSIEGPLVARIHADVRHVWRLVRWARLGRRPLYDRMLSAGVRVFEYDKAFLHAKVAVIDKHWATVGSSNIDPFSLLLSREANLVVRDAGFAKTLHASLDAAITEASHEIRSADHRRRSWLARIASAAAYSLVRLLIGVTRYGGKQYAD